MSEIIKSAISKIDAELKEFKSSNGDNKVAVVKDAVADALKSFCNQEEEFAQAIVQSDKTLFDCCKHVIKGCGNSLSDLEAYSRAVQFYFSTAKLSFSMAIDLSGGNGAEPKPITMTTSGQQQEHTVPEKKQALTMSLDELLDF